MLCDYSRCLSALEFHHLDPTKKDFIISRCFSLKKAKLELDKCILLCSNCHREVHAGVSIISKVQNLSYNYAAKVLIDS